MILFLVVIPSRQLDQIFRQVDVIVVRTVILPLQLRNSFLDDLQYVERHKPQTEGVPLAFEEVSGLKDGGAQRLPVVSARLCERRKQERKLDSLLQLQMADATHAHVVTDHLPAELVDIPPHIERTVREPGGFVLETVQVLLQRFSVF